MAFHGRWPSGSLFPARSDNPYMERKGRTGEVARKIKAKDGEAAPLYHGLSEVERRTVIDTLEKKELPLLTGLIKDSKKKVFRESETRFLSIAEDPPLTRLPGGRRGRMNTPVYLLDETLIEENMKVLRYVKDRTGCRILHALKSYASFATFPAMRDYLDGTCASGLHEARLGHEEFGKEVHTFAAAYRKDEIRRIIRHSHTMVFNSFAQLDDYGPVARKGGVSVGLRVNPGHSEVSTEMYNPCAPGSRLGITHDEFDREFPRCRHMVEGLHFHAMCEQNSDVLERILQSFHRLYGRHMGGLKWVNFGGGHHITRDDYDLELLIRLVLDFQERYGVLVYLEPGEASVLYAGVLVASVLDVVRNEIGVAIIDASAETHMPDVLLMPYRPHIMRSAQAGEKKYTYRIAGPSCLAGDVAGDYSFDRPLSPGDRLVFTDMALYSIVKNTTFNGINLPDIAVIRSGETIETVKRFGYRDYRNRLS